MKSKTLLLFLTFIIFGCSSSEKSVKRDVENYDQVSKFNNDLNIDVIESICWINMMPGTSPKFHISGKINLPKGENYSSETTELKYIKIYQSSEELYYIMPKVINNKELGLNTFTYSTIKGLSINDNLNKKEPVVFELIFVDNKEEFKFRINDVKVEEVQ